MEVYCLIEFGFLCLGFMRVFVCSWLGKDSSFPTRCSWLSGCLEYGSGRVRRVESQLAMNKERRLLVLPVFLVCTLCVCVRVAAVTYNCFAFPVRCYLAGWFVPFVCFDVLCFGFHDGHAVNAGCYCAPSL